MLTKPHRQEALCRAYVQAIAAGAGMGCAFRLADYGIDLTLHEIKASGKGCAIDVQAKSSTLARTEEDMVRYDLEVKAYNDLRVPMVGCPRLLVLLVLPEVEAQWLSQSIEELVVRRCAYWLSLAGAAPVGNEKTVRIAIPVANVFFCAGPPNPPGLGQEERRGMNFERWVDPRIGLLRVADFRKHLLDRGWRSTPSPRPELLVFEGRPTMRARRSFRRCLRRKTRPIIGCGRWTLSPA